MRVFPIAKINLGLNVVSKRPDGYHNLETVFFPVPIHEELSVEPLTDSDKPYELTIVYADGTSDDGSFLCPPEKNLVVKAYMLLREHINHPSLEGAVGGIHIILHKLLPSQAGMGAGSSDAAFMICLLNEQFSLGMTIPEMQRFAAKIGADCAFFITCQPSYATGIGDILEPLPYTGLGSLIGEKLNARIGSSSLGEGVGRGFLALVKPDCAVSTKEAYAGIHPHAPRKNCRDVILNQPIETWRTDLINDFEESIFPKLPVLADIKQSLYDHGALYAAMSGSGSTIFGIFEDNTLDLKTLYPDYYTQMIKL